MLGGRAQLSEPHLPSVFFVSTNPHYMTMTQNVALVLFLARLSLELHGHGCP